MDSIVSLFCDTVTSHALIAEKLEIRCENNVLFYHLSLKNKTLPYIDICISSQAYVIAVSKIAHLFATAYIINDLYECVIIVSYMGRKKASKFQHHNTMSISCTGESWRGSA